MYIRGLEGDQCKERTGPSSRSVYGASTLPLYLKFKAAEYVARRILRDKECAGKQRAFRREKYGIAGLTALAFNL